MHINFKTQERPVIEKLNLPDGTTLSQKSAKGKLLYNYIIKNNRLVPEKDWVEHDRSWRKGEKAKFMHNMTRDRVMEFFLKYDDVPQREYNSMCDAEHELLKHIMHHGMHITDDNTGIQYNIFKIIINRDSDLEFAEKEISWGLAKIAEAYPNWNPIYLDVFDHDLSENGIISINWDRKNSFELNCCTYGRSETRQKFSNVKSMVKYIAEKHYYK